MRVKGFRLHKTGDTLGRQLAACRIEEQDRRQPQHLQVLQQRRLFRTVGGHIRLQQHRLGQACLHRGVAEGVFFELFTGHAPVGVQIQHHRPAPRLLQREIELFDVVDAGKGQVWLSRLLRLVGAESPVL